MMQGRAEFHDVSRPLRVFILIAGALLACIAIGSSEALAQAHKPRMYGQGAPFGVGDLPPGQLRSAFDSLPPQAKARAQNWLESFVFPENDLNSLRLDGEGGVFYEERILVGGSQSPPTETTEPDIQAVTAGEMFSLHSKPGASNVVHLDFDGETITGTAWNNMAGEDTLYAIPYDTDGDPYCFSASEINAMAAIWHRMAEDFAPFDIDVTTEPPSGGYGPYVGHVLVTRRTDANGRNIYSSSAGGVAYVNVWGQSYYASYQPALVFYNHLAGGDVHDVAEASSHEFGHNLGLSHDGTSTVEYYAGDGSGNTSWAPIMGVGYYKNVTQWSKGEYSGANNPEDDIAIITNKLGARMDDHGNTWAGATALALDADSSITVTDPETDPFNLSPANKGVIENRNDADLFYFDSSGGKVTLSIKPAWQAWNYHSFRGANLDVGVSLYDGLGNPIDDYDLTTDTEVTVSANVGAGRYYVRVYGLPSANYSDYASIGQYFISGSISPINLMTNPGFESNFLGWTGDWGNSFIETDSVHSGTKALRVGPDPGGRAQRFYNLVAGTTYTMCAWSRLDVLPTIPKAKIGVDIFNESIGRIDSRQWDVDWTSWHQNSITFTYPTEGDFLNVWVWTDPSNSSVYADDFILVEGLSCEGGGGNAAPEANFTFTVSDLTAAFIDSSTDSDGSVVSWSWDFGDDVGSSTDRNPIYTYSSDGVYAVTLTVSDDQGTSNSFAKSVAVGSALQPNEIMSWVAPYAMVASQSIAESNFGTCSPKDGLTRIGLQFWTPNADGTIKFADHESYKPGDGDVAWWRNWCRANGIQCLLTIYNYEGSWNWDLARSAFAGNRTNFVNSLVAEMELHNLDGIDIDLEGLNDFSDDRNAFRLFIEELSIQLKIRRKILTVNSFPYIWDAPNIDWWPDWAGYVDNIHSMGYEDLYEGGMGWQKYSYQQAAGVASGLNGNEILMGMPAWVTYWGISSGRGTSAQAHVQEVRYDLIYGSSGIAIWDMQLLGWQNSDLWCEIAELKGKTSANIAPAADFAIAADNLTVYFTDASTDGDGTVTAWEWDFGDGNTSFIQNPTHPYLQAGAYSVTLTVTDDDGDNDSVTKMIAVSAPNSDPEAVNDSVATAEDTSVNINVLANDTDADGDSLFVTSVTQGASGTVGLNGDNTVTYTPNTNFNGSDSFTYEISDGIATATANVNVTVTEATKIYVDGLTGASSGDKKRWTATVTTSVSPKVSGVTVSGNWSNGAGDACGTDSEGTCSVSASTNAGSIAFTVTGLAAQGYKYDPDSDIVSTITVNKDDSVTYPGINDPPIADFTASIDDLTVNFNDTSTDPDGSISYWLWDFGDGSTITSQNPEHAYAEYGTYAVTLVVTDDDGETDTISRNVTVDGTPEETFVHIGALDITASGNNRWTAAVTTTVHDSNHKAVPGVMVSVSCDEGANDSCQTDASGQCTVSRATKLDSLSFVVIDLSGEGIIYDPNNNDVKDLTVTIDKP
jgi:PKD repeat protein